MYLVYRMRGLSARIQQQKARGPLSFVALHARSQWMLLLGVCSSAASGLYMMGALILPQPCPPLRMKTLYRGRRSELFRCDASCFPQMTPSCRRVLCYMVYTWVLLCLWLPASAGVSGWSISAPGVPCPCPVASPSVPPSASLLRWVSTTGSDNNDGLTADTAWKTITYATSSNSLTPAGSTVLVRGGVYSEWVNVKISGSAAAGSTVIMAYPDEIVILDGTTVTVPTSTDMGAFLVSTPYITIAGFEIRFFTSSKSNAVPVGIRIATGASYISIINNYVHHIESTATASKANAHGIAAYGTGTTEATAIQQLYIAGNEVAYNVLGSSESMAINGNIDGFTVANNFIHDNNNIGCDAIGGEGTSSVAAFDVARHGTIVGNVVYNITAMNNPSYGVDQLGADALYVDGGANITLFNNVIFKSDYGIELASEHSGHFAYNCTATGNILYSNNLAALSVGGYAASVGYSKLINFSQNVLYADDTTVSGSGEIQLQSNPQQVSITDNVIFSSAQGVFSSSSFATGSANTFNSNTYITASTDNGNGISWSYFKKYYYSLSAWTQATTFDTLSTVTEGSTLSLCQLQGVTCANGVPIIVGYTTATGVTGTQCPNINGDGSSTAPNVVSSSAGVAPSSSAATRSSSAMAKSSSAGTSSASTAKSSSTAMKSSTAASQSFSTAARSSSSVHSSSTALQSSSASHVSSTAVHIVSSSTGPQIENTAVAVTFVMAREVTSLNATWQADFVKTVSSALGVSSSRMSVTSVPGSTVVTFVLTNPTSAQAAAGEPTAAAAASIFLSQYNALRESVSELQGASSDPPTEQTLYQCSNGDYETDCSSNTDSKSKSSSFLPNKLYWIAIGGGAFILLSLVVGGCYLCGRRSHIKDMQRMSADARRSVSNMNGALELNPASRRVNTFQDLNEIDV